MRRDNIKLLNDPTSGIKVGIAQGGISDGDRFTLQHVSHDLYRHADHDQRAKPLEIVHGPLDQHGMDRDSCDNDTASDI